MSRRKQQESKFLVINGDCDAGLFDTWTQAQAEADDIGDPSNVTIYKVVAKYEAKTETTYVTVPL